MSKIVLVDDPNYHGKSPDKPTVPRTWAMRSLHEGGMEVGDIARFYGVPFAAAYRACNPIRRAKVALQPQDVKRMKDNQVLKLYDTCSYPTRQALGPNGEKLHVYDEVWKRDRLKQEPNPHYNEARAAVLLVEMERRNLV